MKSARLEASEATEKTNRMFVLMLLVGSYVGRRQFELVTFQCVDWLRSTGKPRLEDLEEEEFSSGTENKNRNPS